MEMQSVITRTPQDRNPISTLILRNMRLARDKPTGALLDELRNYLMDEDKKYIIDEE